MTIDGPSHCFTNCSDLCSARIHIVLDIHLGLSQETTGAEHGVME